jgi:hypothetical protein
MLRIHRKEFRRISIETVSTSHLENRSCFRRKNCVVLSNATADCSEHDATAGRRIPDASSNGHHDAEPLGHFVTNRLEITIAPLFVIGKNLVAKKNGKYVVCNSEEERADHRKEIG